MNATMKSLTIFNNPKLPLFVKPLIFSFLLFSLLILLFITTNSTSSPPAATATPTRSGIRIRPGYPTYNIYIQRQLNKTLNPKLRTMWKTRDWDRKVLVFSQFFTSLKQRHLLSNSSKCLSIGARMGQEVAALKRIGVNYSIGIDLVPSPPLVMAGDFHAQPFGNDSFEFEFSNVFDHALYPWKFVEEIERTLKPDGVCVLHVAIHHRADKYSANDLYSVDALVKLFKVSELVEVRKIDGFGLDTEVVFRRKHNTNTQIRSEN